MRDRAEEDAGPVRAVLFDYGHTLVDFHRTQEALLEAYEQVRGRIEAALYMEAPEVGHLIDRVAGEVDRLVTESYTERRMQELDLVEVFDGVLSEALGLTVPPDVVRHVVALDHSAFSNSIAVEPAVLRALEALREQGYRLGLVSNVALLPDHMREDLDRLGIGALLDATVFSSEVGTRKPDPRIFAEALQRIGSQASETVFVGDRLYDDVGGARAAGMRTVQTRQFRSEVPGEEEEIEADATIDHLGELAGVLRSLSPAR
jgi:putative hydrolase of the HAD superfamily